MTLNDFLRMTMLMGVEETLGGPLEVLLDCLWPESEKDIWADIKKQVEELIDQKISDLVYQQVSEDLAGLNNNLGEYVWSLKSGDTVTYTEQKWNELDTDIMQQLPHFQSEGYELLLLPLFTQMANMHLAILRDGVLNGKDWGWGQETIDHIQSRLTSTISTYSGYTMSTYNDYYDTLVSKTKGNQHKTEPFNTLNKFVRGMTGPVLDFVDVWPYYDCSVYPDMDSSVIPPPREIYSNAVGTSDDNPFKIVDTPEGFPRTIKLWHGNMIDSMEVIYDEGMGPDGTTTSGRIGGSGGAAEPVVVNIAEDDYITDVQIGEYSGCISSLLFKLQSDGQWYGFGGGAHFSYGNRVLSSISIMGKSVFCQTVDCVVLGFKLDPNYDPDSYYDGNGN